MKTKNKALRINRVQLRKEVILTIKSNLNLLRGLRVHHLIILDKSNNQSDWTKIVIRSHKYADRQTYIDEIQTQTKKRNTPSPNAYNVSLAWLK